MLLKSKKFWLWTEIHISLFIFQPFLHSLIKRWEDMHDIIRFCSVTLIIASCQSVFPMESQDFAYCDCKTLTRIWNNLYDMAKSYDIVKLWLGRKTKKFFYFCTITNLLLDLNNTFFVQLNSKCFIWINATSNEF